jgi:hypothetical protein
MNQSSSSQVHGYRAVPIGWNSCILVERIQATHNGDYAGAFAGKYQQEYRVQLMNEPGSHTLQFSWAIENQYGAPHIREGQITLDVPPVNVLDARAAFEDYMMAHPDEFKIDREVYLKSWR